MDSGTPEANTHAVASCGDWQPLRAATRLGLAATDAMKAGPWPAA